MPTTGRILLALVAITTATGGYIADWNETHVYNPRWPPHAKFHNGQTMSTGLLLGTSTLYYLFRSSGPSSATHAVQREFELRSLHTAAWLATLNWVAQLSAALYPGSLPMDPEFGNSFPQLYICAGLLSMVVLGTVLERRRLTKEEKRKE